MDKHKLEIIAQDAVPVVKKPNRFAAAIGYVIPNASVPGFAQVLVIQPDLNRTTHLESHLNATMPVVSAVAIRRGL